MPAAVKRRTDSESAIAPAPHRSWAPWLVLAAVLVTFAPVLMHEFGPMDDQGTIWANPRLNPPRFDADGVLWYWRHPQLSLYIPVTYLIWGLLAKATWVPTADEQGMHLDPRVFHGASLTVHALTALAVYALLRRLLAIGKERKERATAWPAAAGALLYAVHPLQVEAVAWASGLKDLLSGCLSVTAILLYVTTVQDPSPGVQRPWRRWEYWLGIACLVIAMLCKPSAMVAPLIAAVIHRMLLGRPWRELARTLWPWFLAILPLMLVAKAVQPPQGMLRPLSWHERAIVAGASLAFYLGKLLVPVKLALDYGWRPQWMLPRPWFRWIGFIPLALGAALWAGRRRLPWPAAAALVSVVALLPVLGLVPFQYQFYSTVSDHYVYLAMLGPAMVLAWAVRRIFPLAGGSARIWLGGACAALLLVLAVRTVAELHYWRTDEALLRRESELAPQSLIGHNGLGFIYCDPRHYDPAAAEREFLETLKIDPDYSGARDNLRSLYFDLGRPRDAIEQVRQLIRINPMLPPEFQRDFSQSLLKMGVDAALHHRFTDAAQYLEAYQPYHPDDADARALLAKTRDAAAKLATTTHPVGEK